MTVDYKTIAKNLKFEGIAFINGKYVDAIDGEKFEILTLQQAKSFVQFQNVIIKMLI